MHSYISVNNEAITLSKHSYNIMCCHVVSCSHALWEFHSLVNVMNECEQSNGKIQGWLNKAPVSLSYPWCCFCFFFCYPHASVVLFQSIIIHISLSKSSIMFQSSLLFLGSILTGITLKLVKVSFIFFVILVAGLFAEAVLYLSKNPNLLRNILQALRLFSFQLCFNY